MIGGRSDYQRKEYSVIVRDDALLDLYVKLTKHQVCIKDRLMRRLGDPRYVYVSIKTAACKGQPRYKSKEAVGASPIPN